MATYEAAPVCFLIANGRTLFSGSNLTRDSYDYRGSATRVYLQQSLVYGEFKAKDQYEAKSHTE